MMKSTRNSLEMNWMEEECPIEMDGWSITLMTRMKWASEEKCPCHAFSMGHGALIVALSKDDGAIGSDFQRQFHKNWGSSQLKKKFWSKNLKRIFKFFQIFWSNFFSNFFSKFFDWKCFALIFFFNRSNPQRLCICLYGLECKDCAAPNGDRLSQVIDIISSVWVSVCVCVRCNPWSMAVNGLSLRRGEIPPWK